MILVYTRWYFKKKKYDNQGRKKRVSKDIILITFQTCFFKNKNDGYKKRK